MKSNQAVSWTVDGPFVTVVVRGNGRRVFDKRKASQTCRENAENFGWGQVRFVDAAAVSRADKDGNVRSDAEMDRIKWENVNRLMDHYESGSESWTLTARGGARGDSEEILFEALGRARPGKADAILAATMEKHGMDRGGALKFLATAKVVAMALAEIKAERRPVVADLDPDALLDELAADAGREFEKLLG